MSASFEEKSAWIMLISLLVMGGIYFVVAAGMMSAGITAVVAYVPLFVAVVVVLVVLLVVGHTVVAIASRPDGRDERDQLIEWRAESNSAWVLGTGVLAALAGLTLSWDNVWIAHLLLAFLIFSEIVKTASQLFFYRRGV